MRLRALGGDAMVWGENKAGQGREARVRGVDESKDDDERELKNMKLW